MLSSVACKSCGAEMAPWLSMPLDAKKNEPTPYSSVARCSQCGCAHLALIPDAEEVAGLYELPTYYTHGETHIPKVPPGAADKVLTRVAWAFDKGELFDVSRIAQTLRPSARICDLGCGHALYLRQFMELGFEVVGVEPDPSARAQATAAGVKVLEGTAENLPELAGQFDLVLCTHALEHCRDAPKALRNTYSLTKPGGLCYIEVPNCACAHFETFTICSENFDAPRHIWFFTPDSLADLAKKTGFILKKQLFSGYTRNFSPSWRAWEIEIASRTERFGLHPKRHSFPASVSLFLRSFWRKRERKYDCFGLILQR